MLTRQIGRLERLLSGGKLVGHRGYVISFCTFVLCLVVALSFFRMWEAEKEYVRERVFDEVEANRLWLARFVVRETYVGGLEWQAALKEYCEVEGLMCLVGERGMGQVRIEDDRSGSYSEFPLPP